MWTEIPSYVAEEVVLHCESHCLQWLSLLNFLNDDIEISSDRAELFPDHRFLH